mgnify:FL=1
MITKVFRNMSASDIVDSVEVFEKQSDSHRSSCSLADSVLVMNQTDQQNSSQQHSRMRR